MGIDINCRNYLLCDKLPQSKDGLKGENTGGRISIPCVFFSLIYFHTTFFTTVMLYYFANIMRSFANSPPLTSSNFFRRSATFRFFFSSPDTS